MFNTDSPIITGKEDLLGRDQFAKQLAQAILSHNQLDSFNIGLYGEWGAGKTSVINMVVENISIMTSEQTEKPVIMHFNPWLFSDHTHLTTQFFKQLSSAFKKSSVANNIGKAMELMGATFELTSLVPGIGSTGGIIARVFQGIGKVLSGGMRSLDIQKIKNEIVTKLKKEKVKTIIIIDDMDRLSNQEIRSVFQLIKSIADFPNTIYLLTFDYDVVTRALGDVQNMDGKKYLEKIIQVPFHLPKVGEKQLADIFLNGLNNIVGEISEERFDKERWSLLFYNGIEDYLKTIRDVVRLNNTISLKYSFLKDEVDIIDLIGITVIQVFSPTIYSRLEFYKEDFCGDFPYGITDESEERKFEKIYNNITADLDEAERKNISQILSMLFPKVRGVTGGNFSEYYHHDSYSSIRSGNIYNKDYFDRYFSLAFSDSLSLRDAKYIIFEADNEEAAKLLFNIDEKNQTNLFLNYYSSTMKELKKTNKHGDRVKMLVNLIMENWDNFHDADDGQLLSYPWIWRLIDVVNSSLFTLSEKAERFLVIIFVFNNSKVSLHVKISVLLSFEREYNRYSRGDNRDRTPKEYLLELENILSLEEICFSYIEDAIDTNDLISMNAFADIKWFVENSENNFLKSKFKSYMSSIIQTDDSLAKLVSSLIGRGKAAGTFVYDIWNVDLEYMSKSLDIKNSLDRMSKFIETNSDGFSDLDISIKENVIAFLLSYEVKDDVYGESIIRPKIEEFALNHNVRL